MRWLYALLLTLALVTPSWAANHYIRDGGSGSLTGTGNCADWSTANACDDFPATLVRGDTYYVADGTYTGRTFSTANSATLVITIKKATVADHGTETGWVSTYGDGQAQFAGVIAYTSDYWVFDGQTRNESDWFDSAAYGFSVGTTTEVSQILIKDCGFTHRDITHRFVYVQGYTGALSPSVDIGAYAIQSNTTGCSDGQQTNLTFHKILVRGAVNQFFMRNTTGAVVEYSAGELATGNSANHGENVNLYYSAQNAIVRYNILRNNYTTACSDCGSTATIAYCCGSNGAEIYGNLIYNFRGGDGFVGWNSAGNNASNSKIYNNTLDRCTGDTAGGDGGINLPGGTNNLVYNNVWTNCANINFAGVTHDYSAFPDANAHGEANAVQNFATSNFVNYASKDFRLANATTAGFTLSAPYNTDLLGTTRAVDGTWDRGAYEFGLSFGRMRHSGPIRILGSVRTP